MANRTVISVNGLNVVLSTDARGRSGISCSSCIGARKTIETLARSKILAEEALENFRKEKQRLLIEVKGLDLSLRTALKNTYRKEQFTCGEEVWNEKIDSAPIDAIKLRVNADKEKRRREKAEEARKEQEARKAIFERREKERERMAAAAATAREKQTVAIKKEDMEQKVLEHQQKIEEQVTARNTRLKASRDAMKAKALEEQKPTVAIKQEKTLKRKASILISCQNCGKDFDEEKNKKGACSAHSGYKQVNNDSDRWCDWDEECHGYCESFIDDPEYADGFAWTCCGEAGDEMKCSGSKHEGGGKRTRT